MTDPRDAPHRPLLRFHGGLAGAVAPFAIFLAGVAWLALSGAPDERGFWPVLLAALTAGLALARDRAAYADAAIHGMSRPIVMVMVLAWLLAGVLAALMNASGFVESLVWLARAAGVAGGGFAAVSFLVTAVVATATGTSLGTLLLAAPLLYPAGAALGTEPVWLLGAILGGATFGDNVSPVSDTTIASATTQWADLGGVVRSRMRYALPAAAVALALFAALAGAGGEGAVPGAPDPAPGASLPPLDVSPRGLPMLIAPAVVLGLLLARRHLLEGLTAGIVAALVLGLPLGLIAPAAVLSIDAGGFTARGLIVEGMERGIGVAVFTLLLMGLVGGLEATGVLRRLVELAERRTRTARGAELWAFGATSAAVLLTTHSVVAILTVGDFVRRTGERFGIGPYRRANLLDVTVCTYPFLLPYCIPTILASSLTAGAEAFGMPRITPLAAGMANLHSWALLGMVVLAVATGYGRRGPGGGPSVER
ncbi:MAG: Na+/H+ antiporter NhaC family protein [Acidobacteriota bacterium]|jgi:Na+/H+ antiporter NhaC